MLTATTPRHVIASWSDGAAGVLLWREEYPRLVGLTITATLDDEKLQKTISEGARLAAVGAPGRERDRQEAAAAAIKDRDIVEVADALCDIQYVLSGAILEFGLGDKFKELFEEVQRSNMSKACSSEAEALQTVEHYKKKDGTECYYRHEGDKWLVYRKSDHKTIKSIAYSPADLKTILDR